MTKKFVIARYIGGTSLNGREYVLNNDKENSIREFDSSKDALDFLANIGITNLEENGLMILEQPEEWKKPLFTGV